MLEFKFLKDTVDSPEMLNETTRATASFNADTPEGYYDRRRRYFTEQAELYYRRFETNTPPLNREEVVRRFNRYRPTGVIHNDNHGNTDYVPFFTGGPRVRRPEPNLIEKISDFIDENSRQLTIMAIVVTSIIFTFLVIGKILHIW